MVQNTTTDVEFIVVEKTADGRTIAHGVHKFRVPPRVGEHLGMEDANRVSQGYRVIAVALAADPIPMSGAGDLYVRHVGTEHEMVARL